MENTLSKNAVLMAKIFCLPAAAGFLSLFLLNFLIITAALLLVSAGLLCAPIGGLYTMGLLKVVSDLSPAALTAAGLFCLFFGCFLCFFIVRFSPFCFRLFNRYRAALRGYKWRRLYSAGRKSKMIWFALALSALTLAAAAEIQYLSSEAGFESTVVRERLVFNNAKYLKVSTSNLNYELRFHDGDGILVEYVNDTPMIIEQTDANYLKLVQDDSFTLSLFARDQFRYKMTVWLPENDYREFYLDSGSGSITLTETLSDYTELRTRSGNITVTEATEEISAYTIDGVISCAYSAFMNNGSFESRNGNIFIELPDYSGIELVFRTESGYLDSGLLGFEDRFYGSVDAKKTAALSRYLYVTTAGGGVSIEAPRQ
ncbi:MAG: DUF4097 domain-containing protein [Bacteroides sp.]|nr:DUF4097 domain-containing protein [Bacteroides sp.]